MNVLKIKSVKLHILEADITPQGYSQEINDSRDAAILEIETHCGIVGWGECFFNPATIRSIVDQIVVPHLMNKNPYDWKSIRRGLFIATVRDGPHYGVISGVEIALLDIVGKDLSVPINILFGGAQRDFVSIYATGCYRLTSWRSTTEVVKGMMEEIKTYVDSGFATIKVKVGFSPLQDSIIVNDIANAIGRDARLAVDANAKWDLQDAVRFCAGLEDKDIAFLEEPFPVTNLNDFQELKKKTSIPLATGEGIRAISQFRDFIQKNVIDIIQPDIIICGGFTALSQVQALSLANNIRFVPHCWGTGITFAATSHFMATLDGGLPWLSALTEPMMEFDKSENPLRDEILMDPLECHNGMLKIPTGYGLGVEINRKSLEKYRRPL